jgi:hypothetical protein
LNYAGLPGSKTHEQRQRIITISQRVRNKEVYLTRAEFLEALKDLIIIWQGQEESIYNAAAIKAANEVLQNEK